MKENKNKKVVIITITGIIILCIILISWFFIEKTIQFNNYIRNHDFISAGNMDETFYDTHSQDIVDMIDTNIGNNEMKNGLEIYEKLFDYILSSKKIDYDSNSELWYRYKQVEEYLPQNLKDKYLEIEYKYIVEQGNNNKFDDRTTYSLFSFIFNDEKYNTDKKTQYLFLDNQYKNFKNRDDDCRVSELSYLKESFIKLGDFENASEYVTEIDTALKWQGSWVGFGGYKNRNLYQVAIKKKKKKVYTCYISSPWTTEPQYYNPEYGTAKFEFIDDRSINVAKESGYPIWSKAIISLENDKIIYSYESFNPEKIELSRETDEMNFVETANKLLEEHPNKSASKNKKENPKIGMSASEVRQSTWGYPDKINKDTYSWGTTEQWVYKNKGYIYLRNGIVTSISER